jgi:hypothetical protein
LLKKAITYTDFNGEETTEIFFFNLSKAELVELELSHKGGLSESLKQIAQSEDGKQIIKEMKNIILSSYGKKSPDGKRFIKNQQLRDEFESSEAYSVMFMELVTDADAAVAFVQGILPAGMTDEPGTVTELRPEIKQETITRAQVESMSNEEFVRLGQRIASGEVVVTE